jgi:hypothetical protein
MLDSVGTPIGTMQSLLGHSTPDITREIYLHAIPKSNVAQWKVSSGLYLDPNGPKFRLRYRARQAE